MQKDKAGKGKAARGQKHAAMRSDTHMNHRGHSDVPQMTAVQLLHWTDQKERQTGYFIQNF